MRRLALASLFAWQKPCSYFPAEASGWEKQNIKPVGRAGQRECLFPPRSFLHTPPSCPRNLFCEICLLVPVYGRCLSCFLFLVVAVLFLVVAVLFGELEVGFPVRCGSHLALGNWHCCVLSSPGRPFPRSRLPGDAPR